MSGISMMEEEHFRNNLILLEGKNFGKIFEIIVSRLANLEKAGDASHDWYCSLSSSRIEVKAIRAFFSHEKMNDGNLIEMLLEMRLEARKAKDFARSDAIRDRLSKAGVVLEDGVKGTSWRIA